jgi:esterase/lipase superfamily enzyme
MVDSPSERRTSHSAAMAVRILAPLLICMLAGCATRPGPEVLTPVAASVPAAKVVTVYVATTRERASPRSNVFTNARARELNYAEFKISIPPRHQAGQIEWPQMPDPATSFTTVQQNVLDRQTFEQRIAVRDGRPGRLKVGVFVHGFNNNFQEALFCLAQMTADAEVDGAAVLFAWPSQAKVTDYVADRDAVTYSRDQLVDLLTMLAANRSIAEISVIGHSMGAWLTVEALRQLRLARNDAVINRLNVILAAPDIDVDVFRAQMDVVGPLSTPMTVLVARDDIALAWSGRIAGARQRVGTLAVDDPRVEEAALKANIRIIDISTLKASDAFNHDRYANLAALYRRLAATESNGAGHDLSRAGAFIFNAVGTTLSSPFGLAGSALSGQ